MNNKVLELNEVDYTYFDGTKALSNINIRILKNEKVAIIGPNGSGKTTLLLVASFLYPPTRGSVKLFDNEEEIKDKKVIRKKIGIVFQDPDMQIFNQSVFDEIVFSLLQIGKKEDEAKESTDKLVKLLRLDKVRYKMPHRLSFGEKRKLTIASVIAKEPEILLVDEPTSNLDPKSRREIIEVLKEVSTNSTFLFSTHDLEAAFELSKRIIVMYDGKIVYDGKTEDITKNKETLKRYDLIYE
ncbi:MAG: energy-coupling factor ABC transporter ATP-binding protein [Thermoproteota archaeon]|nr:energy-coupling factor ABC transporter ATP-binding protein [Candidatus Brockarchaeota archaeon]